MDLSVQKEIYYCLQEPNPIILYSKIKYKPNSAMKTTTLPIRGFQKTVYTETHTAHVAILKVFGDHSEP